jgi:penicillin-binding protein 2
VGPSRQAHPAHAIRGAAAVALAALLAASAACSAPAPPPDATPTSAPTATPYPPGAGTAVQFVDALNRQDFDALYSLLDQPSRERLKDVAGLAADYLSALNAATALTVTYQLRGGLLARGAQAVASWSSAWQTVQAGTFEVSGTLELRYDAGAWRIPWTRDLILPSLEGGQLSLQRQVPPRGDIFAADGSVLALHTEVTTLGVRRGAIKDAAQEAAMLGALSELTGLSREDIRARYASAPADWWVPIADLDEDAPPGKGGLIAPYEAVSARTRAGRRYEQTTLAPHVVGFVGPIPSEALERYLARGYAGSETVGLSGVEAFMEPVLAGQAGVQLLILKPEQPAVTVAEVPFQRGADVTLSLSPTLQRAVQSLLGARPGAAVVLDARSDAVLAMATYPSYDLAVFTDDSRVGERAALIADPARPMVNRATQAGYPPGSTFKMVTFAAGVSEGLTTPDEVFADPGYWDGLGKEYRKTCWLKTGHGRITLQNGLSASCNVVFYELGKRLDDRGQSLLAAYARRFGFGQPTGVELAGEYAGIVPDPEWKRAARGEVWTTGDGVNMAVGQGFMLVTPLQVAQMAATIANDGQPARARIVASPAGAAGEPPASPAARPDIVSALQAAMQGVTSNRRYGTTVATFASLDYYQVDGQWVAGRALTARQRAGAEKLVVAGKSGTAQAPGADDKPFAWFAAYAPASDPRVAVAVVLENAGEGSAFAAPLARQVVEASLGLPVSQIPSQSPATD